MPPEPQSSLRVLSAFLASPSDLDAERQAAKDVVDGVNRALRSSGWRIELLGWEDTLPGLARPQELINQDVDGCDLFLGALNRRWGQATGDYSSGFEEEYERARSRSADTGSPEIWLFFRQIPQDFLADPGEQLQKVLAFQQSIRANGELLYKEFADEDAWKAMLWEYLTAHLIRLSAPRFEIESKPQDGETPDSSAKALTPSEDQETSFPSISQALETLAAASRTLAASDLYMPTGSSGLERPTVARLYLLAASWLSELETSESLTPHAIQLIYRHRKTIAPTGAEQNLLLRTLVGPRVSNVAGWFWFRQRTENWLASLLVTLAMTDSEPEVRVGALERLTSAEILPSASLGGEADITTDDFLRDVLTDPDPTVQAAALRYVEVLAPEEAIDIFAEELLPATGLANAPLVRQTVLARREPDKAMTALLSLSSGETIAEGTITALIDNHTHISAPLIASALEHPHEQLRSVAVEISRRRRTLKKDQALELLTDPSARVRLQTLDLILSRRWSLSRHAFESALQESEKRIFGYDDDQRIRSRYYETRPRAELEALLDWTSVDGPKAYRALALHDFEEFGDKVRADLSDGFASYREQYLERYETEHGRLPTQALTDALEKGELDTYIRNKHLEAALDALATKGSISDRPLFRQYLDHEMSWVRLQALIGLARFALTQDVDDLIQHAQEERGRTQQIAAEGALLADSGRAIEAFLGSDDPFLVRAALVELPNSDPDPLDIVLPLLHAPQPDVRKAAVVFLENRHNRSQLREILDDYIGGSYYYNVVCWLDRISYSRGAFLRAYRRELAG